MNELYILEEEPNEDVWIILIYKLSTTLVGASVYVYWICGCSIVDD